MLKVIKRKFANIKISNTQKVVLSIFIGLLVTTFISLKFAKPKQALADMYVGFDEGFGTNANDVNSAVPAGTIVNAVWKPEELCRIGKCLFFDGTGDYITFADNASFDMGASDTVTVEGWFRTSDITSGSRSIVSKYETTGADGGYRIYINSSGQLVFGIDGDNTSFPAYSVTSTNAYDDNFWHHFAAVKNGTTNITLYVDGASAGTTSIASTASDNNDIFYIGRFESDTAQDFLGFIDDVRVLRTARTASQVKTDYTGATASSTNIGPVGWWKFDETSGSTAYDVSGNSNNATVNGASFVAGKYNNALSFNGSSNYINAGISSSLSFGTGNFSISAWVYPTSFSNEGSIYDSLVQGGVGSRTNAFSIVQTASTGKLRMFSNSAYTSSTTNSLRLNSWNHVEIVRTGTTVTFYINGVADATTVTLSTNLTNGAAVMGKYSDTTSGYYAGKIDDVKAYNYDRTPSQVIDDKNNVYKPQAGVNASFGPDISYLSNGLVGYWRMDESATPSVDLSGNSNDGTWQGTPAATNGKYGNAIGLNGTTQYLSGSASTSLTQTGDITISAWVYRHTAGHVDTVIDYSAAGETEAANHLYLFSFNAADQLTLEWEYGTGTNVVVTSSASVSPTNNAWGYYTVVRRASSKEVLFYQNGVQLGTTQTYSTNPTGGTTSTLVVGRDNAGTSDYIDGNIDELRVYNRALTSNEIKNLYYWAPGPIAYWKFDEHVGNGGP